MLELNPTYPYKTVTLRFPTGRERYIITRQDTQPLDPQDIVFSAHSVDALNRRVDNLERENTDLREVANELRAELERVHGRATQHGATVEAQAHNVRVLAGQLQEAILERTYYRDIADRYRARYNRVVTENTRLGNELEAARRVIEHLKVQARTWKGVVRNFQAIVHRQDKELAGIQDGQRRAVPPGTSWRDQPRAQQLGWQPRHARADPAGVIDVARDSRYPAPPRPWQEEVAEMKELGFRWTPSPYPERMIPLVPDPTLARNEIKIRIPARDMVLAWTLNDGWQVVRMETPDR